MGGRQTSRQGGKRKGKGGKGERERKRGREGGFQAAKGTFQYFALLSTSIRQLELGLVLLLLFSSGGGGGTAAAVVVKEIAGVRFRVSFHVSRLSFRLEGVVDVWIVGLT